ncbi:Na/Pi symporter [candidate division KSB1 bacterium]
MMSRERKTSNVYFRILLVFLFLYLFLVSIGLMSAAFKGFGADFAENLIRTTSNPFVGLFIGILATSLVQSSSTTTSVVVGLVSSGVLTIEHGIPIIMGANIGTTVTNTLVSMGHITRKEEFKRAFAGAMVHDFFNLICVAIMFPLEIMTGFLHKLATGLSGLFEDAGGITLISPVKIATKPVIDFIVNLFTKIFSFSDELSYILVFIASILLLFFSLYYIVRIMKSLIYRKTETVMSNILERKGMIIGIFAGLIFTAIVQSSSITTSLLVPLIGAGILTIEVAFPITMGANIGTTTTAILASFATGDISAITIAFVHFLFNVIGVCIIFPIKIFRQLALYLAKGIGEIAVRNRKYAIVYVLCIFFVIPALLIVISNLI